MKRNICVEIPDTAESSYSLYAQGAMLGFPAPDEETGVFRIEFAPGSVAALFYTFAEFRRVYLVTQAEGFGKDIGTIRLPGVQDPVSFIFAARGARFDRLKNVLFFLEQQEGTGIYLFPLRFWQNTAAAIDFYGGYKSHLRFLLDKYKEEKRHAHFQGIS